MTLARDVNVRALAQAIGRDMGAANTRITSLDAHPSYEAALSAEKPADLNSVSAKVNDRLVEWVRDPAGTCLGGGWSPAGDVTPGHWGIGPDGEHDLNPVVNYAALTGRAVLLPYVVVVSQTVNLPSGVIIRGSGMFVSGIRAADGMNDDVVKTSGFDELTGSNKWLVSEGVPVGFGLYDMHIDGNKQSNASGRGWVVYGKGYFFDRLLILNTAQEAWVSECANKGGQESAKDLPEGDMGSIFIFHPGTRGTDACDGMVYRGPHDGRIRSILVASSDGTGAKFESDNSTYNGKCDVDFMHVYGCYRKGIVWGAGGSATHLIGESCDEEGVLIQGFHAQIGMIEAYRNCIRRVGTGRVFNVYASGAFHNVGQIETRDSGRNAGGISNASVSSSFKVLCDGMGSPGIGVKNTGDRSSIIGHVLGFNAPDGRGVDVSGNFTEYNLTVKDCTSAVYVTGAGYGVQARIRADLSASQTVFTGVDPISGSALNKETSNWDVTARVGGTYKLTRQRRKSGASFDATQAVGSTGIIEIGHNIPFTPDLEDVTFGVVFDGGSGGATAGLPSAVVTMRKPPDADKCYFLYQITASGSGSDRGFITMSIRY